jgi:hypothetical protein
VKTAALGLIVLFAFHANAGYEEDLQRAFSKNLGLAQECNNLILKIKDQGNGRDTLKFTLSKAGKVKEMTYNPQTPRTEKFGQCLTEKFKETQFPKPPVDDYAFDGHINWDVESGTGDTNMDMKSVQGQIRTVVRKELTGFQACYNTYLDAGGKKGGKFVLRWSIDDTAKATNISVKEDEIQDEKLSSCMIAKLKVLVFPKPPKNTVMEVERYPFVFSEQKKSAAQTSKK